MLAIPTDKNDERYETGCGVQSKAWRVPRCPFLVEYSCEVLDQIAWEANRGRNSRFGEREIGGVLFGSQEPGRIRIVSWQPLQCEHAMGPGFVLSKNDEERLARLILAPATDPALSGLRA